MIVNLDPARVKSVLEDSIAQVFAEMAFLDAAPIAAAGAAPGAARGAVSPPMDDTAECIAVDVLKPVSIRVELKFTPALKRKVVETLFDGAEQREGDDSLLEILNVTVGNFLIAYFGPQTEPKLELPEYVYFEDLNDSTLVAEASLLVEGEPLVASVRSVRYRY